MQNQSQTDSQDLSSLLKYENSEYTSSWMSCETPTWKGWGKKTTNKCMPYISDSSPVKDDIFNHKSDNEWGFTSISNNLTSGNNLFSKYLLKSQIIPYETNNSTEDNPHSRRPTEEEIKLRTSDDYEIHTITEESEEITQTDFKQLTPSTISSKPITPNKRYSNHRELSSTLLKTKPNTNIFQLENFERKFIKEEKLEVNKDIIDEESKTFEMKK